MCHLADLQAAEDNQPRKENSNKINTAFLQKLSSNNYML